MPVNFASLSIQTTLSSASAASASFWVCLDPPITIGPLQSGNRLWASWPGLMRFTWRIPVAVAAGWWTTWPEKAFRSAEIEYETSCSGWIYGRFTRSHAPQLPVIHLSVIHALWISIKSSQSIRRGIQTSCKFHCKRPSISRSDRGPILQARTQLEAVKQS